MSETAACPAVVLFSTADWFWPYWTNKQHIAVRLAARGYRVLYIESLGFRPPGFNRADLGRIAGRLRRAVAPTREVQDNIWVLSPLTIPTGQHSSFIRAINSRPLRARIEAWLRRLGCRRPLIWTYHPYMLTVAEAFDPAGIVYHCVDDLGAIPGIDPHAFAGAERSLIDRADHIFATSRLLHDRCAALAPRRTHYFPNVADVAHFGRARRKDAIPSDLAAIPRPRLGYVGVLSNFKLDFGLLEQVVSARQDWHFVFIGDEREGQHDAAIARLKQRRNTHFLGYRPYATLPDYLRGIDVALLPQQINDYTRAMFPMKFFEYIASGRPLVATPLPALAEFNDLHRVAATPAAFIDAIAATLAAPGDAVIAADHPLLCDNSWDRRLDTMLRIIRTHETDPD